MHLLILGGTVFLGRHLAQQALDRGWDVTLFNRGQSNPDLFPQANNLVGDRLAGDLAALESGEWDVCIDTCGYVPRVVRQSSELLRNRVGHYQFVSTISVFADFATVGLNEDSPVGTLEDETTETITGETYGPLKALCEQAVREVWGEFGLIVRPGLIIGPDDKTDRFTYWPVRMATEDKVLVPDSPKQPVQMIDVRDLCAFMLDLTERRATGTYNATGPNTPWTFGDVLQRVHSATASRAQLIPASTQFLIESEVSPWSDLPLWLGEEGWGTCQIDVSRALAAGLKLRSLEETARDTLAWWNALMPVRDLRAGLTRERELALLGSL